MTTDFETAARDQAEEDLGALVGNGKYANGYRDGFRRAAAWARDHLAAQEPDDARKCPKCGGGQVE